MTASSPGVPESSEAIVGLLVLGDLSAYPVDGLHVYTLGNVVATERWRLALLERLGHG